MSSVGMVCVRFNANQPVHKSESRPVQAHRISELLNFNAVATNAATSANLTMKRIAVAIFLDGIEHGDCDAFHGLCK